MREPKANNQILTDIGKKLCYCHSDIFIIFKNYCTILKYNALWRQ